MPKPLVKPVQMDVSLEFHEKLIDKVGKSLEATKKRLYNTELVLNLEPNPDEKAMVAQWHKAVNEVLSQRPDMNFPTMRQIKKEHAMKELQNREVKNKKRAASRQNWNRKMNEIIEKQTRNLQKMVLDKEGKFGGSIKGEPLRTIENYNGGNSIFKGSRTLIRKAGNGLPDENETSLPPWFHPHYYDVPDQDVRSDKFYQIPFKSLPRKKMISSAVIARENYLRRKKAVRESTSPPPSRDTMRARSFRDLQFDEDSENEDKSENPNRNDKSGVNSSADTNDDDNSTVKSNASSVNSSDSVNYYRFKNKNFDSSQTNSLVLDGASESPKFIYFEDESNSQRKSKGKEMQARASLSNIKLLPIKANHTYALKILSTEEKIESRWQVPDYTMNALANQPPLVFDEFRLEDSFVDPEEQGNTDLNALTPTHEDQKDKKSRAGLKYSSEIFSMRPKVYKPPNDIIADESKRHQRSRTSSRHTSSPHNSDIYRSTPASPYMDGSRLHTSHESTTTLHENGDNMYSLDGFQSDDASSMSKSMGLMKSSLDLTRSNESIATIIDEWCRERGVSAGRSHRKPKVKKDDFLSRHPVLPSIDTSLHGLLLEENPYTENDPIIKKNKGVDVDKIRV